MAQSRCLKRSENSDPVERCVVVTTDKVYRNNERPSAYREIDPLGGGDPYSASDAAAEIAAHAYAASFRRENLTTATTRAGNVLGGSDVTPDALMPEFMNAYRTGRQAVIRYLEAVRPWQHVLEPLTGYLKLAESLGLHRHDTAWNFGSAAEVWLTVAQVADRVAELWEGDVVWQRDPEQGSHEIRILTLDSAKARSELGWIPTIDVQR
jgi:CDP-glucose 4,6-dehydratase